MATGHKNIKMAQFIYNYAQNIWAAYIARMCTYLTARYWK
jgi:hypothetical protein